MAGAVLRVGRNARARASTAGKHSKAYKPHPRGVTSAAQPRARCQCTCLRPAVHMSSGTLTSIHGQQTDNPEHRARTSLPAAGWSDLSMPSIPPRLPNAGLSDSNGRRPRVQTVHDLKARVIRCAPASWQAAIRARIGTLSSYRDDESASGTQGWDLMQAVADSQDEYGTTLRWSLSDRDIRDMAQKLAEEAYELDALAIGQGGALAERVDSIRMLVRMAGIAEDKPIAGEPAIRRAQDAVWWRRRLRVQVARAAESGFIRLGLVHQGRNVYVSDDGLRRRQAQLRRNAEALGRTLLRNKDGQVYSLRDLAALGTSNPAVRAGELMTRIRGAEEYADSRAHVGMFLTLTLPSRFHPVKHGSGGRPISNERYSGATPHDGQMWLRSMWAKTRAALQRQGVRMYGLRVVEPHHDATPHWHVLVWTEDELGAMAIESTVRRYWLSDDGRESGALENRVDIKRMIKGGAAGYVARYIAKSVGQVALTEHQDVVNGETLRMPVDALSQSDAEQTGAGHRRVDAWASTWGLRQFQAFGMPSVTVWRELRRVSEDQLESFDCVDYKVRRAYTACHRRGQLRADWRQFMEAMGGHSLPRCQWHLRTSYATPWDEDVNRYGEKPRQGRLYGVEPQLGRMAGRTLVSKFFGWRPVVSPDSAAHARPQGEGRAREPLSRPWTRFNNCTPPLNRGWLKLWSSVRARGLDGWPTTDPGPGGPGQGPIGWFDDR
jgi:hypothetical protein